jgi:hypothetical protein
MQSLPLRVSRDGDPFDYQLWFVAVSASDPAPTLGQKFGAGRPRLTLFGATRSSTDGGTPFFLRGVRGAPNLEPPRLV